MAGVLLMENPLDGKLMPQAYQPDALRHGGK